MSQEHLSGASSQADSVQHRIDAVGSNDENETAHVDFRRKERRAAIQKNAVLQRLQRETHAGRRGSARRGSVLKPGLSKSGQHGSQLQLP